MKFSKVENISYFKLGVKSIRQKLQSFWIIVKNGVASSFQILALFSTLNISPFPWVNISILF